MNDNKQKNIEAIYPLSAMQQGMLFHYIYNPESAVYFEQFSCLLHGELNQPAFEKALQELMRRHSTLRTSFVWKKIDKMLQVVQKELPTPLEIIDWRGIAESEQKTKLEDFLEEDRKKGFNLSKAPLLRFYLLRLNNSNYRFIWSFHHLLTDGWSIPIILKDLFTLYEAFHRRLPLQLPPARPYRDYIIWLQQQNMEKAAQFWKKTLGDFRSPTPLPVDRFVSVNVAIKDDYPKIKLELSKEVSAALDRLTRQNQMTANTMVQAAWALLLSRYSGEDDVVFGATVSGRPPLLEGVENMVGLFINTLPMRISIDTNQTALDWLKTVQSRALDIRDYEFTPLIDIQGWSAVPRNLPLFTSIVVFENYPVDTSLKERPFSFEVSDIRSFERTNYPLTFVAAMGVALTIEIAYEARQFEAATIQRLLNQLQNILSEIAINPLRKVGDISLVSEPERKFLLEDWNNTAAPFDDDLCIHQKFEWFAQHSPQSPAVRCNGQSLSYGQLNQKANQFARLLLKKGIHKESLIGICMDRSPEMIIAILGVLKAGGAYVPMDPNYPGDRLSYMIEDAHISLLLSKKSLIGRLPDHHIPIVFLDDSHLELASAKTENLDLPIDANNLAYIIYTSGSTGRPKGVMLRHQGVLNLIYAMSEDYPVDSSSHVLQFASFSFDASIAEIFLALLCGASLYLAERETLLSVENLSQFIAQYMISVVTLPPSMLALMNENDFPTLKSIVSAGEACTWEIADRWSKGRSFLNGYGPTEGTVGCCWHRIDNDEKISITPPIGSPIKNTTIYLLDRRFNLVPQGVPGEIYIGGVGLARGYLNRPDLTAEKFIPNPFNSEFGVQNSEFRIPNSTSLIPNSQFRIPNSKLRLYRTGDLARLLPNGKLEFLGRIDHQVKLRGFRIELGEIEATLTQHPLLKDAVVIVREDQPGNKYLTAYYIPVKDAGVDQTTLQSFLKGHLPEYMIPAVFVELETFPLTANGKVDRKNLPLPDDSTSAKIEKELPRNPTEELLLTLWRDVLRQQNIGISDNFFDLGGHSLLATQLASRLRDAFNVEIPLRDFFEAPYIASLALKIDELRASESSDLTPPLTCAERPRYIPLSFAQQRLWFLDQLAPGMSNYNIPTALRLTGKLNASALERSVNEIIKRHEALRTTFDSMDGEPIQIIHPTLTIPLQIRELNDLPAELREEKVLQLACEEANASFNLKKGPLFRAQLLKLADEEHVVLFTLHHAIADGWSMGVLVKEFAALYGAYAGNSSVVLPDLPVQYADFAIWQRSWLHGETLQRQINFWKERIGLNPPALELPTDHPRPAMQTFNGRTLEMRISKDLSEKLNALSRKEGATIFMTLLAAFQTLLRRYSSQDQILVGSPIANRTRSETEALIGFFVNTLIFKADFSDDPDFRTLLKQVRETTLQAYAHQDLPFEQLVEALQPERDMSRSPLFQVAFILQNVTVGNLQLPDLTINPLNTENQTSKYDITLNSAETPDGIAFYWEYNTDLFEESTIRRMMSHLQNILIHILADPKQRVSRLQLMDRSELKTILHDWNQTACSYPDHQTAQRIFEEYVSAQPAALAAEFETQQLTYRELNIRANQLAYYLRSLGLNNDTLIGFSLDRSLHLPVVILGILKTGGAFLSIDPTYPAERISYMLEDSGVRFLITEQTLLGRLPCADQHIIYLDRDWPLIAAMPENNPVNDGSPENLAYIIYTSGSTGKPKGTLLSHRGLCNLAKAQQRAFGIHSNSKILQFSSLSFDASVWETVMALLNGAALVYARQEMLSNGQGLFQILRDHQVTTVTLPPSVLAVLPEGELPQLKTLVTAGEKCTLDLVQRWGNGRQFVNAYGPTETTVCASMYNADVNENHNPPIGKPIDNFQLYVLDRNGQPLPIGAPGELYIGGVGLARGYLNRPDLTAEKFIPNPFIDDWRLTIDDLSVSNSIHQQSTINNRLYRTGDLVRWLPGGDIEFLGRVDFQVKIRGFRIELGEIESVITSHAQVHDAAVVACQDKGGEQRMVAYYVPANGSVLSAAELRSYMRQTLPEYMIPSIFMSLETMPLTPNGKVDRKALPEPEISRADLSSEFVAPRNEAEKKLCVIVAGLLHLEKVGIHDNFFELGGHSLLATKFMSRIRDQFQVELPLRILFEKPTVAQLGEEIGNFLQTSAGVEKIERVERSEKSLEELLANIQGLSDEEVQALLKSAAGTD